MDSLQLKQVRWEQLAEFIRSDVLWFILFRFTLFCRLGKTLPEQILNLPPSKSKDIDGYAHIYDDLVTSPVPSDDEDSFKPVDDDTAYSPVVRRKPSPPLNIYMDINDRHGVERRRPLPPLPPRPQKPSKIASDNADCSVSPEPRRDRDKIHSQESEDDNRYDTCWSAPERPPVVLHKNKEDSANPSDVKSCKPLPLPMTTPRFIKMKQMIEMSKLRQ